MRFLVAIGAAELEHRPEASEARDDWFTGFRVSTDVARIANLAAVNCARLLNAGMKRLVKAMQHGVAR